MEIGRVSNLIYFLIGIAALVIILRGIKKRRGILKTLKLEWQEKAQRWRKVLALIGLFIMIFALLEPRVLKGTIPVERRGLDIFFLVDVSKSMLTDDIKPNRLERARETIRNIILILKGDRVGFIPFSSEAYIQMPLTEDYDMAQLFLSSMDTDMMSGGGTNIAQAITLAAGAFDQSSKGERVLIVISDGEEHNAEAVAKAKELSGVKIYTVGLGTPKGALVPELDLQGKVTGYKKDNAGNYVVSRLNEEILKALSETGKGKYFQVTMTGNEVQRLVSDIAFLKRDQLKVDKVRDYQQLYQYFLGLGLLLFTLSYLDPDSWVFWKGRKG